MAREIIVLGDTSTHGGTVITASPDVYANGRRVARVGDLLDCGNSHHGTNKIKTGSDDVYANGKKVARYDDETECGAKLRPKDKRTVFVNSLNEKDA